MKVILLMLFAYLMGSVPYSLLFAWIFTGGKVNLKKSGTGNVGTENVWMIAGWIPGLLTAFMDMTKVVFAMLLATWWLGWNMTDNTMEMMLLSIPAWIGHCFPIWLKFSGGMGNGVVMGSRFYVGGPVVWLMGQVFLTPNVFIKDKHYKVAFNHAMALGVNFISAFVFLILNFVHLSYFQWGLFHVIGQPVGNYMAVFWVSLIWVGMYMARRLMYCSLIQDLKSGISLWRAIWPRIFFEGFPEETTHQFADEEFKLVDTMFWKRGSVATIA